MNRKRGRSKRTGSRTPPGRSVNLPHMSTASYWGLRDIAEYLGVEYSSARTYHGRSEIHRRQGVDKPGDMPAPDARFGNSPVWLKDRIVHWKEHQRPGKGAGGGRPKNSSVAPEE